MLWLALVGLTDHLVHNRIPGEGGAGCSCLRVLRALLPECRSIAAAPSPLPEPSAAPMYLTSPLSWPPLPLSHFLFYPLPSLPPHTPHSRQVSRVLPALRGVRQQRGAPGRADGARGGGRRRRHRAQQPDHVPHPVRAWGAVGGQPAAQPRRQGGRAVCTYSHRCAAPAPAPPPAPPQPPGRLPVWPAVGVEPVRGHAVLALRRLPPADVHRCAGVVEARWEGHLCACDGGARWRQ